MFITKKNKQFEIKHLFESEYLTILIGKILKDS